MRLARGSRALVTATASCNSACVRKLQVATPNSGRKRFACARQSAQAEVVAANDNEILALPSEVTQSTLWPATKLAIEFQLLTGSRSGEVRFARWSEIDTDQRRWFLSVERGEV